MPTEQLTTNQIIGLRCREEAAFLRKKVEEFPLNYIGAPNSDIFRDAANHLESMAKEFLTGTLSPPSDKL